MVRSLLPCLRRQQERNRRASNATLSKAPLFWRRMCFAKTSLRSNRQRGAENLGRVDRIVVIAAGVLQLPWLFPGRMDSAHRVRTWRRAFRFVHSPFLCSARVVVAMVGLAPFC